MKPSARCVIDYTAALVARVLADDESGESCKRESES